MLRATILMLALNGPAVTPGSTGAGGSSPQVQYNNSGSFGGVSAVTSDGVNLIQTETNVAPSTPAAGKATPWIYTADAGGGTVGVPMTIDGFLGGAIPTGLLSMFQFGSVSNWQVQCATISGNATSGGTGLIMYNQLGLGTAGSVAGGTWGTGSFQARMRKNTYTASTGANFTASLRNSSCTPSWRGDGVAGHGGFIHWQRIAINTTVSGMRAFFGLANTTAVQTGNPSAMLDTAYVGCDADGGPNLGACTNDNSGLATCQDLGTSFPCDTTNGAVYDIWIAAPPGGSVINFYVERLDTPASVLKSASTDLPRNTVQQTWHSVLNNGTNTTAGVKLDFSATCTADNP